MEWIEMVIVLIAFTIGSLLSRYVKSYIISRKKCYVCNYPVGKTNRVNTNGEWYHFNCWVKFARTKVFGDKVDKIQ